MAGAFGGFMAGSIVGKLLLDKSGWNQSVREVGKDKQALSGVAADIGKKMQNMGRSMSIAGLAILGTMTGIIKAFASFDQAMTESLAIMGDVSDTMRTKMANAAKQMSGQSTFAATELAKSYFYLASAGLNAEESIAALPVVTKFAQAGAFDLARATDLLTDAQSALGLSTGTVAEKQQKMIRVSDVLVKANTLANASVSQFSEALTNKAGPAMRAYGVSLESGVATLAAFADQGVKGSEAGSQFSIVLRDLQKAALGNRDAFKAAGIAVYDANGNLNNMGTIVGQLEKHLSTMSAEQKKATLSALGFQERSQGVLLTLIGTSDKIKEYEANLKRAGGITEEVAQKQLESLSSQLKIAKNNIVNVGISLGEKLAPTIIKCAEEIVRIIEKIQNWIEVHPKLTEQIGLTTLKLGAFLVVAGSLLIMLPKLAAGFTLLWGAITGPAGLVALAIASVVVTIKDLVKTHKKALDEMSFNAKAAIMDITADGYTYMAMLSRVQKEGGETLKKWKDLTFRFGADYVKVFTEISTNPAFADLKTILDEIIQKQFEMTVQGVGLGETNITLCTGFKDLAGAIVETHTKIKKLRGRDGLTDLITDFVNAKVTVQEFHEALKNLDQYNFKEWLKENFPMADMEEDLKQYITEWESAPSALKSVFASIGMHFGDFKEEFKKKTFDIKEFWKSVNEQIEASWIRGISKMITEFKNFGGAISQFLNTIFQMFADTIAKIVVEWIKGTINMKEAIEALGVAVKTFSTAAILWIGYVITKVFDLNKKTEQSIYLLELQIERARELLEEWKRIGLGINMPSWDITGPDEGHMIEMPDYSSLLGRIPTLLATMIANIKTLDFVTKKMFRGLGDILADLSKRGADYKKIIEDIRDTLGDKLFNQFKKWKEKHGKDWEDIIDWAKKYNIDLSAQIPRIQRKFDQLARITAHSFYLLIAQGANFFDALMALKEPLEMLRDKVLELGLQVPPILQPILDMFEKIAKRPQLYAAMSATLELFKAFVTIGHMTQDLFKDFTLSIAAAARDILGVSGNLKKALSTMGDLTKEQIMMLAPLIMPFLEAAQKFGLRLPDWVKRLVEMMGLEVPEQVIDLVPPILERIIDKIGRVATRLSGDIRDVVSAIKGIPGGASGLDFYSGNQGGLVRYHAMENVSIQPAGQPNINISSTPVNIENSFSIDGHQFMKAVSRRSVEWSEGGHFKMHKRGIVS